MRFKFLIYFFSFQCFIFQINISIIKVLSKLEIVIYIMKYLSQTRVLRTEQFKKNFPSLIIYLSFRVFISAENYLPKKNEKIYAKLHFKKSHTDEYIVFSFIREFIILFFYTLE